MKKFNSISNYVSESTGDARTTTFVVANDIDRNDLSDETRWSDLFPHVEIDGRTYITRYICGQSGGYPSPTNLNKGTSIGISIIREMK